MKIIVQKPAEKFITRQSPKVQERLYRAIFALPQGDVRPLVGKDDVFRLRVGDYRVTFHYTDNETIIVRSAGNRGDVYKH